MRTLLFVSLFALASGPALALEQAADGDWFCGTGTEDFGALSIAGESYRFTDLAGMSHDGELAAYLDGVTYDVTSGTLSDIHRITQIVYGASDGLELLTLNEGDALTPAGTCHRPNN